MKNMVTGAGRYVVNIPRRFCEVIRHMTATRSEIGCFRDSVQENFFGREPSGKCCEHVTVVRKKMIGVLVEDLTDRELKRAGLDYHEYTRLIVHANWTACLAKLGTRRRYALTTRGQRSLFACALGNDDVFVFGRETSGLPEEVLADFPEDARVRIPMQPRVRSLNISNAVAITVYEAWRQTGFAGAC